MAQLDYGERDALKTILRAHDLADDELLLGRLETFAEWIREIDQAKFDRYSAHQPPLPLAMLSLMGIYGKAAQT